jgi:hypothetical protein
MNILYNKATNEITFPHIISGNILGGKVHNTGCINGGFRMVTDAPFNLIKNRFLGGISSKLGLIKEYGFYACPHFVDQKKIVGFYIHDPESLTELGKRLIKEQYPSITINFITTSCTAHRELTPKELEHKKELIAEAIDKGLSAPDISTNTPEELEGLLRAVNSGKAKTASGQDMKVEVEQVYPTTENIPIKIEHRGRVAQVRA